MCGILYLERGPWKKEYNDLLTHRGRDGFGVSPIGNGFLAHWRLSIIDLSEQAAQPMEAGSIVLAFNGEIWNYQELKRELKISTPMGDTRVLAMGLSRKGPAFLERLHGMVAAVWYDGVNVLAYRDSLGEVPLYIGRSSTHGTCIASEIHALMSVGCDTYSAVGPGAILKLDLKTGVLSRKRALESLVTLLSLEDGPGDITGLRKSLSASVRARLSASDVPQCVLLSGGIDSSIIAYEVAQNNPEVVAYFCGDTSSSDYRHACIVAEAIGIELELVPLPDASNHSVQNVKKVIESNLRVDVQIGACLLALSERMRSDGFKVVYGGDGSDEIWESYGRSSYFKIKKMGWTSARLDSIHKLSVRNLPRGNKACLFHGVEPRMPFVDRYFIRRALQFTEQQVHSHRNHKAPLVEMYRGLLPDSILNRSKVAFQVGNGMRDKCDEALL